jgi:hypothetical protein
MLVFSFWGVLLGLGASAYYYYNKKVAHMRSFLRFMKSRELL